MGGLIDDVRTWADAVHDAARLSVVDAVNDAVADAVDLHDSARLAVVDAVNDAVAVAVRAAVHSAVGDTVRASVGGAVGSAVARAVRPAVGDAVGDAVDDDGRDDVYYNARDSVADTVGDAVGGAVFDAVAGNVNAAVVRAVGGAVDAAVGDAVDGAVHDAVADAVTGAYDLAVRKGWNHRLGGAAWSWWPAMSSFYREVCHVDLGALANAKELAWRRLAESCWWIWPHRRFAIVTDRPKRLERDERGRLHCEDGPSIAWDGWALWHIHGVGVTEQVVLRPETLTLDEIDAERNADVRAVMIARWGYPRYLQETGATLVDYAEDQFGRPMALMDCGEDNHRILVCTDGSTPRAFHCPVPRDEVNTCQEAEAWLSGGLNYSRCIAAS
jgi:hypothetical protein